MESIENMQDKIDLAIKTLDMLNVNVKKTKQGYMVSKGRHWSSLLSDTGILEMAKSELANSLMCFSFDQESKEIRRIDNELSLKIESLTENETIDGEVLETLREASIRLNEAVELISKATNEYNEISPDLED